MKRKKYDQNSWLDEMKCGKVDKKISSRMSTTKIQRIVVKAVFIIKCVIVNVLLLMLRKPRKVHHQCATATSES